MPYIEDYINDITPGFVVVPETLHENITKALDAQIAKWPDAEKDREILHSHITSFFHKYGYIPEFTLEPIEKLK
jgi:hypothetical protein